MFIPIMSLHEAAHAWVAHLLGDDTAKDEGRLTLNPAVHIDLWGTLIIPAINVFLGPTVGLIGWGKPVPVDLNQLRNYRRDDVLVAMAGPLANFLFAFVVLLLARLLLPPGSEMRLLALQFAMVSIFLGFFNLIPIPPLDGYRPLLHLFRLPEDFIPMGGIWWLVVIVIVINFPPVIAGLDYLTQLLCGGMVQVVGF